MLMNLIPQFWWSELDAFNVFSSMGVLSDLAHHTCARKYIKHIQFTPPELQDEIHWCTLERWPDIQAARQQENQAQNVRKDEPPPAAEKETGRGHDRIHWHSIHPPVTVPGRQGHKDMHIDGAKKVASFVPLSP